MFRKLVIAVITAWAALLETVADAIEATLPLPPLTVPGCGWLRPGGYASGCSSCHSLTTARLPLSAPGHRAGASGPASSRTALRGPVRQ